MGERQVVAKKRTTTVCRPEGMQMNKDRPLDWKPEEEKKQSDVR